MAARGIALGILVGVGAVGCGLVPPPPPIMAEHATRPLPEDPSLDELARTQPAPGNRSLLVVHQRSACSGSTRMILVDRSGTYYGAVAPGEAALLEIPVSLKKLTAISAIEIIAPPGSSARVDRDVDVPPAPSGILFRASQPSSKSCYRNGGFYGEATLASQAELESIIDDASEIRWLEPKREAGQAWLAQHRRRLDELLVGRGALAQQSP